MSTNLDIYLLLELIPNTLIECYNVEYHDVVDDNILEIKFSGILIHYMKTDLQIINSKDYTKHPVYNIIIETITTFQSITSRPEFDFTQIEVLRKLKRASQKFFRIIENFKFYPEFKDLIIIIFKDRDLNFMSCAPRTNYKHDVKSLDKLISLILSHQIQEKDPKLPTETENEIVTKINSTNTVFTSNLPILKDNHINAYNAFNMRYTSRNLGDIGLQIQHSKECIQKYSRYRTTTPQYSNGKFLCNENSLTYYKLPDITSTYTMLLAQNSNMTTDHINILHTLPNATEDNSLVKFQIPLNQFRLSIASYSKQTRVPTIPKIEVVISKGCMLTIFIFELMFDFESTKKKNRYKVEPLSLLEEKFVDTHCPKHHYTEDIEELVNGYLFSSGINQTN